MKYVRVLVDLTSLMPISKIFSEEHAELYNENTNLIRVEEFALFHFACSSRCDTIWFGQTPSQSHPAELCSMS